MAKNKNKGAKTPKKNIQNPPVESAETAAVTIPEGEMTPALAELTLGQIVKGETCGLDANHLVDLNGQIVELFVKNRRANEMFGEKAVDTMTRIAGIGAVAAVADAVVRGNSSFAFLVKRNAYEGFAELAAELGVKMPAVNALPAPDENGNVQVEAKSVKVNKAATEQVKKEQQTQQEGDAGEYEMDPVKLVEMGEEEFKKSINYLFVSNYKKKNGSLHNTLVEGVDFIKKYRLAEAEAAENKDEAIAKLNDRNMFEWMKDVMSYVDPSIYFVGVGKSTLGALRSSGSPLSAFTAFRSMLSTKVGINNVSWSEQEIIDALCAILHWQINIEIAAEKKGKDALDTKAKGYKDTAAVYDNKIAELQALAINLANPDFDIVEKFGTPEGDEDRQLMNIAKFFTKMYYPDCKPECHYKNLDDNVRQRMGIILNMFRSAGNKNQNYSEANLTAIEEYTEEEWKEYQDNLVAEAEKARAELDKERKSRGNYVGEGTGVAKTSDDVACGEQKKKVASIEREMKKAQVKKGLPTCTVSDTANLRG